MQEQYTTLDSVEEGLVADGLDAQELVILKEMAANVIKRKEEAKLAEEEEKHKTRFDIIKGNAKGILVVLCLIALVIFLLLVVTHKI